MNIEKIIKDDFSGCIFVKIKGEVVFQKAFGYSDMPNKIPNEVDTKFPTASAGKVFVAVGILQLIERGKLRLDDTIGKLLDFDLKSIDKGITIRQLLCHTSGIPDYFDESVMTDYSELWRDYPNYKIRSCADLIPLFIDKPMMYPKGERFQYNNTGYAVLGLIIEKLSGMPFDVYLEENVFEPCGMSGTGYYELDRLLPKCANAYIWDDKRKEYYTNIYSVDAKGTAGGGAYTTVSDVDRFWTALLGGKLISADLLVQMISLQSSGGSKHYGYGVWLRKANGGTLTPYIQGQDPGVSFISSYDTVNNVEITAVSNKGDDVWSLRREIASVTDRF